MAAPGYTFNGLVARPEVEIGLVAERDKDGFRPRGYNGSTLYAWNTDKTDPFGQGGGLAEEERAEKENPDSVNVKRASIYLCGCLCYNFFCCCARGWCSAAFCIDNFFGIPMTCCEIRLRRDRWLWILHFICFCIHFGWAVAAYTEGMDSDMKVEILRVKASWENRGGNYGYEVVPANNQFVQIHVVTALFFGFSALMHGIWVFFSPWTWSKRLLWNQLDNCLCYWRWLEYSFSASLMAVGIAVTTAIRDQNTLAGIFFLHFSTMWCGFFTELLSRPAKNPDGTTNYDRWAGDPEPPKRIDAANGERIDERLSQLSEQYRVDYRIYVWEKWKNYSWRMFPHFLGFFPYATAWSVILNNFLEQIDDLCEKLRDRMPDFVFYIVYGSVGIFSIFTVVQWRYQWTAPRHYWRTELWYCVLSATSKVYLYINVLAKKSFNEAVSIAGENYTSFNLTAYC